VDSTSTNILRRFRKSLVKDVYNICLINLKKTLNGEIKDKFSLNIYDRLNGLDENQLLATEELC
jgi:hypothetical protein